MAIDANVIFMVLVAAAVFAAAQGLIGLLTVARQKAKVNQRLKVAENIEGISALVLELRKQRGLTASGGRSGRFG